MMATTLTDETKFEQIVTVPRGRTCTYEVIVYQADQTTRQDITGFKLWLTIVDKRETLSDGTVNANYLATVLQLRNTAAGGGDDEIEITDAANGECSAKFTPANTSGFDASFLDNDFSFFFSYQSTEKKEGAGGRFVNKWVPELPIT